MAILKRVITTLFVSTMLVISSASFAAETAKTVGKIIATSGTATATLDNKTNRPLKRGAVIYQNDTLVTGENSTIKLRMDDSALMEIAAKTRFKINSFNYDKKNAASNKFNATLENGAMRTISGAIKKNYAIKTEVSTIGIRGTKFAITFNESKHTAACAVLSGTVSLTDKEGKILDVDAGKFAEMDQDSIKETDTAPAEFKEYFGNDLEFNASDIESASDSNQDSQDNQNNEAQDNQTDDLGNDDLGNDDLGDLDSLDNDIENDAADNQDNGDDSLDNGDNGDTGGDSADNGD